MATDDLGRGRGPRIQHVRDRMQALRGGVLPRCSNVAVGDNLGLVRVIDARRGEEETIGDRERANRRRYAPSFSDAEELDLDVVVYNSFDDVPPISDRSTRYLGPREQQEFFAQRRADLEDCITAVVFSPDGSRLASAGGSASVVRDPGAGELIATLAGMRLGCGA